MTDTPAAPDVSTGPRRDTIKLFQTHDASGALSAAEFLQAITSSSRYSIAAETMRFLAPLNPRQSQEPGVFFYEDPVRGSGWLRLEGFENYNVTHVQELVRMAEISRAIGAPPWKHSDREYEKLYALRSSNPWILIGLSLLLLGFMVALFATTPGEWPRALVNLMMGGLFGAVSIWLLIRGSRRVSWWHRARAYARREYGSVPYDLRSW